MTSELVVRSAHRLPFATWMRTDLDYVRNHSLKVDVSIMVRTALSLLNNIL